MRNLTLSICILLISASFAWAEPITWKGIVVHHSATDGGTVESIRNYHVNHNGWNDIGYHYVIYQDGSVHNGRNLATLGAHAIGRNDYIGVCLIGKDAFTTPQRLNLAMLCEDLAKRYNLTKIEPHHEKCPGPGLDLLLSIY